MKNPLNKRLPRELRHDFGKYIVIFLFLVMLISLVSGFLITDGSVKAAYDEGFTKYKLEWGHVAFDREVSEDFLEQLEAGSDVKLYELQYFEEEDKEHEANIRVYRNRTEVNLEDVMSGNMPEEADEIALDRMYAKNAGLEIGDNITLNNKVLKITGMIAVPDYSCLFENNSDMMFDSIHFGVAVMSEEGYNKFASAHVSYNYAWMYNDEPEDDKAEKKLSDTFRENLVEELTAYDTELAMKGEEIVSLKSYLPRYMNKAITFTGEDMGSDKVMFLLLDYIVIAILAFVFGITISNTIAAEAGVIGTLRASGYARGELVRHYMVLPLVVSFIAAVVGNVIGYTIMCNYFVDIYYNSYSLCSYVSLFNAEAFLDTTVIPMIIMFIVNLVVLTKKMRISPLQFLRHETSKKEKEKPIRLNTRIPIMHRFRTRIILQNLPNYVTLVIGIVFAAVIFVFGGMMVPLMDDYSELVSESKIADYQYVLMQPVETANMQAEKYCVTSLNTLPGSYMEDEIMVYGVQENSKYIDAKIPKNQVLVSNGFMKKYQCKEGGKFTLKDPYSDEEYDFTIAGDYNYDAALAIFVPMDEWRRMFDKADAFFTGYFSNEKLADIDDAVIASVIDVEDLRKVASQLKVSMGDMMGLFEYFGVIMFMLMMYLLSKQIIEKNAKSISITKILGYTSREISGLYIVSTSIVVLIGLLVAVPLTELILRWAFEDYIYKMMTGYIPFIINRVIYVKMIAVGIVSFGVVAVLQMYKINKIPKSDALKTIE